MICRGAAHAGVVDAPVEVAAHHLVQVVRLTLLGEQLAVPDAVQLRRVVAHLLPAGGVSLQ